MEGMTFDLNSVIYLLGLAAAWGALSTKIKALEEKVDKHNNMVERVFQLEKDVASDDKRLEELERLHPRTDT